MISADVKEVLDKLNQFGESAVFGGYLRDIYLGLKPNDVDIVTNVNIDLVEKMFSSNEKCGRRITINGQEMFYFKYKNNEKNFFEIVFEEGDIYKKAKEADYTINSLMYKDKLIDINNGFEDIKNKIIRAIDKNIIEKDLISRPYLWLKTIRMVSKYDFELSSDIFNILNKYKYVLNDINDEIFNTEGCKIINGKGFLKSLDLLKKMNIIKNYVHLENNYFNVNIKTYQKLFLLYKLQNKQLVDELIKFYKLKEDVYLKYNELLNANNNKNVSNKIKFQLNFIENIIGGKIND